jgi:ABC-type uncharacterized transport system substrate-binding protein
LGFYENTENMKNTFLKIYNVAIRPFLRVILIITAISTVIVLIDKSGKRDNVTKKRLALIQYSDSPLSESSKQGIVDGLAANGYVQGKDYELNASNAQGDIATLNLLIDAVVNDKPDLVFITSTPPLQSAVKKIKNIPVVFSVVADPILAGAGKTFVDHLPNFTGISTLADYEGAVKWIKSISPAVKVIGTLFTPGELNSVQNLNTLKRFADLAGIKVITVPINSSQEIVDATLALTSKQPDLICQVVDNLTSLSSASIIKIAREHNIPVVGLVSDQARMGAVLVVARDFHQAGVDAVRLAIKVFNGEDPSKIPFEFVSKTVVILNPAAAKSYHVNFGEELYKLTNLIILK